MTFDLVFMTEAISGMCGGHVVGGVVFVVVLLRVV